MQNMPTYLSEKFIKTCRILEKMMMVSQKKHKIIHLHFHCTLLLRLSVSNYSLFLFVFENLLRFWLNSFFYTFVCKCYKMHLILVTQIHTRMYLLADIFQLQYFINEDFSSEIDRSQTLNCLYYLFAKSAEKKQKTIRILTLIV